MGEPVSGPETTDAGVRRPADFVVNVEGLRVTFPAGRRGLRRRTMTAVDDVSFVVEQGKTTAIVGESGSGKSTILRALVGLNSSSRGVVTFGERVREPRKDIQMVFQDPFGSLNPRMRVRTVIEEQLVVAGIRSKSERAERVLTALDQVGLDRRFAGRFPHQLSGGERQRVAIARSLSVRPEVLLLDEPLSALDVTIQAQVVKLLAELQRSLGLTYLFVTHDLALASEIADRVIVLYLGRVVEEGTAEQVLGSPAHPYTQALLSAVPIMNASQRRVVLPGEPPSPLDPPSGCTFRTRCPRADEKCAEAVPELRPLNGEQLVRCHYA